MDQGEPQAAAVGLGGRADFADVLAVEDQWGARFGHRAFDLDRHQAFGDGVY